MRAPVLLAAAVLALPGAAAAKEIRAIDVCGTDGCTRIVDRAVLRGFEQGTELAEAAPAGRHSAYELRVRIRVPDAQAASETGWKSLWLPGAHLIAFDDGEPGATFTPVAPAIERALARAARGHTARAARHYSTAPAPAARIAEVVPAPAARAQAGSSGPPALAWTGFAAVVLIAAGAWRARRG